MILLVNVAGEALILGSFKKILLDEKEKDLRSVIKALLKERFSLMEEIYPMLRIVVTEAIYHEDIRKILYDKVISRALEIFTQFQHDMVAKGLMRKEFDPLVVSRSIYGNLVGLFVYRKLFGPMIELKDFDQDLENVVDIIMYGITVRENEDRPAVKISKMRPL